jgi:lysophospholipase L1-like esterase
MGLAKWNMLPYRAAVTLARSIIGLDADRPRPAVHYWRRKVDQHQRLAGGADVLIIGDSLVEQGAWSEWLAPMSVHNRGIGNDTVYGLQLRIPRTCEASYGTTIVMVGVNDATNNILEADFAERYRALLQALAKCGGRIIVHPIIIPNRAPEVQNRIQAYNRAVAAIATVSGAIVVDLNPILSKSGALAMEFSDDGLHLNGAGYMLWAKALKAVLVPKP